MKKVLFLVAFLFTSITSSLAQITCIKSFSELPDTSLTSTFINYKQNIPQGYTVYENWDFGDGQTATYTDNKLFRYHTYSSSGWYNITKEVAITNFRNDTICISDTTRSFPVGFVHNAYSCTADLWVEDTVHTDVVSLRDSSPVFSSPVLTLDELYFIQKGIRGGISLGYPARITHNSGNSYSWSVNSGGDQELLLARQFFSATGQLVAEAYDEKNTFVDLPISTQASITWNVSATQPGQVNFSCVNYSATPLDTSYEEQFAWDFGEDHAGAIGVQVAHTYLSTGKFRVRFWYKIVKKSTGEVKGITYVSDTVSLSPYSICSADFDYKHYWSGGQMDNRSMNYYSPQAALARYEWYFEDGSTSTSKDPYHTLTRYANPITLIQVVEDAQYNVICADTVTKVIYDSTYLGTCQAWYRLDSAQSVNGNVAIRNISSPQPGDPGYLSISYLWDFGDGTTSNQPYPSHTYQGNGPYNVCLTVTSVDSSNYTCIDTYCRQVGIDSLGNITYKSSGFTINVLDPYGRVGQEEYDELNVSIYPNPATNFVNVEGIKEDVEWKLYNLQGEQMANGQLNAGDSKIDFGNKKPGLYILTLNSASVIKSVKLKIN